MKKFEKLEQNNSAIVLQRFPYCPRQARPKWAAHFWISHFQTFNFRHCFICLKGIKVAHFERVKGFGGLKGAPGETPENGRFYINWPFSGVSPGAPFIPPNPFTLSKCATFMSLKHIKQWRKLNVWKSTF